MGEIRTIPPKLTQDEWNALLDHSLEKTASYIVRVNGSYYEAIGGKGTSDAGKIVYGGASSAGSIDGTSAGAVIQAANDALTSGGIIFIKQGTYTINSQIQLSEGVEIWGEGIDRTKLISGGNNDPLLRLRGSNTAVRYCTLDGNKTENTILLLTRMNATDPEYYNMVVDSVKIRGILSTGHWLLCAWDEESAWKVHNVIVKDSIIEDYGTLNTAADNVSFSYIDGVFVQNTIFKNLGRVINFYRSKNGLFENVTFEDIDTYASLEVNGRDFIGKNIIVNGGQGIKIERCATTDIYVNNVMIDAIIRNVSSNGVTITDDATYPVKKIKLNLIIENESPTTGSGVAIGTSTGVGVEDVDINLIAHKMYASGVYISDSAKRVKISGTIKNCNQANGAWYAVAVINATDIELIDLNIYDDQGTATQIYGVKVDGGTVNLWQGGKIVASNTKLALTNGGTVENIRDVTGYVTENNGTATFSGDGATTTFNIAHGLAVTPTFYTAEPLTSDARADHLLSVDSTNITITFDTAPPSGTDNVKFSWKAER